MHQRGQSCKEISGGYLLAVPNSKEENQFIG